MYIRPKDAELKLGKTHLSRIRQSGIIYRHDQRQWRN